MSKVFVVNSDRLLGATLMRALQASVASKNFNVVGITTTHAEHMIEELLQHYAEGDIIIFSDASTSIAFLEHMLTKTPASAPISALVLQTDSNFVHTVRLNSMPVTGIDAIRSVVQQMTTDPMRQPQQLG